MGLSNTKSECRKDGGQCGQSNVDNYAPLVFGFVSHNLLKVYGLRSAFNLLVDVIINAKDGTAINKNLGEDVEYALVNLARRRKEEGNEGEKHAERQQDDSRNLFDFHNCH